MAANIEIKAILHNVDRQFQLAVELAGKQPERLVQRDTFFQSPSGRLKLRDIQNETSQLIHYFRDDDPQLRKSDYVITPVSDSNSMSLALERSMGTRGVVSKVRSLWIVNQTRIHFDVVENLGDFVELEFVLQDGQDEKEGHKIAAHMMELLDIRPMDVIQCAYIDLLEQQNQNQRQS